MQETVGWRPGLLAGLLMALVSLVPQAHLCYTRGRQWQGHYAYFYSDEPAYAAYLNALASGRPRRTDPYVGLDDRAGAPPAETLFSIQFLPAYLLAWPARLLHLKTATVFILLMPLVAFALALAVYRLLAGLTRDEGAAFAGTLCVLAFGILVSGQGFVVRLLGGSSGYVFLPFLRRYVPGVPLVFFFAFCAALWRALDAGTKRARLIAAAAAGLLFAAQVYSYFYHWTQAAALLVCVALAWALARPARWRDALAPLAIVAATALASLAPYLVLLSRRAPSMDSTQALLHTRAPDFGRGVILCASLTLLALALAARLRRIRPDDRAALFTAALAASVLVVFNQQIVTGLSLQPMHYEQYVGNYVALASAAAALTLIGQRRVARQGAGAAPAPRLISRTLWVPVAAFALAWGACESASTTLDFARFNHNADDWAGVTARLDQLARSVPHAADARPPVVFTPSDLRSDLIPAGSGCAVVWAPHTFAFSSVTREENRRLVFQFLHFSGVAPADFAAQGRDRGFLQFSVFGWERANARLTQDFRPVSREEIAAAQREYADYVAAIESSDSPPEPRLSFVVVSDDHPFSLRNLARFYTLDEAERAGRHTIYRATPKQP